MDLSKATELPFVRQRFSITSELSSVRHVAKVHPIKFLTRAAVFIRRKSGAGSQGVVLYALSLEPADVRY